MGQLIARINTILAPVDRFITTNRMWISRILLVWAFSTSMFLFFPNFQKDLGSVSWILLLCILFISPLSKITGIKFLALLVSFRKEFGIMMGMLALLHASLYFVLTKSSPLSIFSSGFWIDNGGITFLAWGFLALFFTLALFLTSNTYSQKKLGKNWKILHKCVYWILILTALHIMFLTHEYIENGLIILAYIALKIMDKKGLKLNR